jgi:hypothetical protein
LPYWTTLPQATHKCQELVRCSCKKGCSNKCKCLKASLTCTPLCFCGGDCTQQEWPSVSELTYGMVVFRNVSNMFTYLDNSIKTKT